MKITEIIKEKESLYEKIREFSNPLKERILQLELLQKHLIQNSNIIWKDNEYKISEIEYVYVHFYDDCPYTPGWKGGMEEIRLRNSNGLLRISNPDNEKGWYDDKVNEYKDFLKKFKETFGIDFSEHFKIKDEYRK